MAARLNRKQPFATVIGDPDVSYIQSGRQFDLKGDYVKDCPDAFLRKPKRSQASTKSDARADALARATEKLGLDEDEPVQSVPQEVIDAERENAAAAAAETNAE